ncbi:hypothetical protein [Saccharothrix longispora]|uniref:hypothetical protein n=1 Tax=Saccharothrix longispora TaxID=33920 RepID=UPI0028FD3224|nr:hypothetical protein [Saccharothrix longispora]MDU0288575.1 hypothetical protein [Saccharothrix longispora]
MDIAGSSAEGRHVGHRLHAVHSLRGIVEHAFKEADVEAEHCDFRDRGDGYQILVDGTVPKARLVRRFVSELVDGLLEHNERSNEQSSLRLRVALHYGEVTPAETTEVSKAMEHATRIQDARHVRDRLRESGAVLALVVSEDFHKNIIDEVAAVRERYDFAPFEEEFRGTPLKARLCLFGGRAPLPPDLSDANARETGPACPGVPRDRSDPVFDVLRSVIVLGAPGATARQERTTAPVLFGPPGSGRSRTERWLCEDLAERGQWWVLLGADRDRGSRPVADLLLEAAVGLVGQDGPWDFSRLLGHLVARSVRRAGGGVDSDPLPLPRSGDDLEDALGGLVRTAGLGDDARPQVRRMTTRLLRPRWTRPRGGHDWHRRIVALREFADLSARADRESGERADRVLMTAFLEDLAAVEPGGRRVDPVVVISSDIDAEPLLRAWGGALTAGTRARATFVAVGDRALVEKLGLPHDQAIPAGREDVERLSRGATAFRGPHTPLPLSGLTAAQLEAMAVEAGVPERHRERLVSSVLRLSAGHAEAGAQLVRAACLLPPAEWTPRLLLGVRAHDGSGPLRDYLLDRLLAGRTVGLDDAVTRSAARNQAEAALLMTGARQARLKGSVLATEWACTGPGGVPVMHPLLRLLLVERLAERPADAPDSWEAVFTRLAGFAKRRGDEEGELHHRFAAGDVDGVLGRLEELLTSGGGRRWLDVVEIVASCPARPGTRPPRTFRSPVEAVLRSWHATGDVHLIDEWADHHITTAAHLRQVAGLARSGQVEFLHAADWHEEQGRRQPRRRGSPHQDREEQQ